MVKKILWIDDDINRHFLRSYIDEFEEQQYRILKVNKVDDILTILNGESDLSAIIVDIAMPPGDKIDLREARGGLRTGMIILERMKKIVNPENVPMIVFTNVDDDAVKNYCTNNNIPYLKKEDFFADELVEALSNIISENN